MRATRITRKYKMRIISIFTITTLIILVSVGLISLKTYSNIKINYEKNIESIHEEAQKYAYTLIYDNQDKSKTLLENKTKNIQKMLLSSYNNNELLAKDIKNPREDSKLSVIFDDELLEDGKDDNIFVGSVDKIVWNRNYGKYSKDIKEFYTWNDVLYTRYNTKLSGEAIRAITDLKVDRYDFIIWQDSKSDIILQEMDMNVLLDELKDNDYNINKLKAYNILIPVYITEDGDIFDVKDVNVIGRTNDNCKMIMVQKNNIYEILAENGTALDTYKSQIKELESLIEKATKEEVYIVAQLLVFVVAVVIVSGNVQNRLRLKE